MKVKYFTYYERLLQFLFFFFKIAKTYLGCLTYFRSHGRNEKRGSKKIRKKRKEKDPFFAALNCFLLFFFISMPLIFHSGSKLKQSIY